MKVLLVLRLAETFFKKEEEVSVTGYEWYVRNRDDGKLASGGMGVLVHMSLESRVKRGAGVGRKMMVGVVYVNPEGVRVRGMERQFEVLQVCGEV